MLTSGDVVELDLGPPQGREAGFSRPAVVVTAQRILDGSPLVVQVVPLTSTIRAFYSEVLVEPDATNGLDNPSAAQCQHLRALSTGRLGNVRGNVGAAVLSQVREVIALLLDLPG
ncbi:MAG: type II toxin-antitoxin system PemK/MazF family toxin [Acidimicrobiia bacterium]|nr:type II toxin-antitoxin system PemK/MazF family toxin [Acidimicrobiia bacterium]